MSKSKPPQTYNDGILRVYRVENIADPGNTPVNGLTLKIDPLRYQNRMLGVNRFFAAKSEGVKVDLVVRIPRHVSVSTQDICIPNDGQQYEVKLVQHPPDVVPPSTDLTLERITKKYLLAPVT